MTLALEQHPHLDSSLMGYVRTEGGYSRIKINILPDHKQIANFAVGHKSQIAANFEVGPDHGKNMLVAMTRDEDPRYPEVPTVYNIEVLEVTAGKVELKTHFEYEQPEEAHWAETDCVRLSPDCKLLSAAFSMMGEHQHEKWHYVHQYYLIRVFDLEREEVVAQCKVDTLWHSGMNWTGDKTLSIRDTDVDKEPCILDVESNTVYRPWTRVMNSE